jgi:hypothetical protein
MAYNDTTKINISLKKLGGKSQTSNEKGLGNEPSGSFVTVGAGTVFGANVPGSPATTSLGAVTNSVVEYVRFYVEFISGTDTSSGRHGFRLKLPYNYEAVSQNPKAGTYPFINAQNLPETSGSLQLVTPSFHPDYVAIPYYDPTRSNTQGDGTVIPALDSREWYLDYNNGVFFQQTPPGTGDHASNPQFLEGFLYIGNMSSDVEIKSDRVLVFSGSLAGEDGSAMNPQNMTDTNFWVSGSIGSKNSTTKGTSVFGGEVAVSGSLHIGGEQTLTGALFIGSNTAPTPQGSNKEAALYVREGTLYFKNSGEAEAAVGSGDSGWIDDGTVVHLEAGTDSVGIGTASPTTKFHLFDTTSLGATILIDARSDKSGSVAFAKDAGATAAALLLDKGQDFILVNSGTERSLIIKGNANNNTLGDGQELFVTGAIFDFQRLDTGNDLWGSQVRLLSGAHGTSWPPNSSWTTAHGPQSPDPREFSDTNFWVSGSQGSKGGEGRGVAVFGGDLVVSGALHGGSSLQIGSEVCITGSIFLKNQVTAPTPQSTGETVVYANDSGQLFWKDAGGSAQQVASTGAGSAGGWTDDGTLVRLTTTSDKVGIGTQQPDSKLEISDSSATGATLFISTGADVSGSVAFRKGAAGKTHAALVLEEDESFSLVHSGSEKNIRIKGNVGTQISPLFVTGALFRMEKRFVLDQKYGPQVLFLSGVYAGVEEGVRSLDPQVAQDINFWVSGSIDSKNSNTRGAAIFGGDVVTSGSLWVSSSIKLTAGAEASEASSLAAGTGTLTLDGGASPSILTIDTFDVSNTMGAKYLITGKPDNKNDRVVMELLIANDGTTGGSPGDPVFSELRSYVDYNAEVGYTGYLDVDSLKVYVTQTAGGTCSIGLQGSDKFVNGAGGGSDQDLDIRFVRTVLNI